jgi:hypothetical protein
MSARRSSSGMLLAGESALAAHAHEQALTHFERGLAARRDDEELNDQTAALLFGLGRAQLAAVERHELETAANTMQQAFDYYVAAGNLGQATAVAGYPLSLSIGMGQTAIPTLISRALELVPADSQAAGRLLAAGGLVEASPARTSDVKRPPDLASRPGGACVLRFPRVPV